MPKGVHGSSKYGWTASGNHRRIAIAGQTTSWRQRDREQRAGRPCPFACEVCGNTNSPTRNGYHRMHFDHCHETGKFRGWICGNCNRILGLAHNDSGQLRDLADYLDRHNAIYK